jgi:hypothetical protein
MSKEMRKHINKVKTFGQFLNESTLKGEDISAEIDQINNINRNIGDDELLIELKNIFNKRDILFTTIDRISILFPQIKKDDYINDEFGIKAGFIGSNLKIFVIIDVKDFLYNLQENNLQTIFTIKKVLNHELVHREQYKKIGQKIEYVLLNVKSKTYLDEPRELMAYAKTVIDELKRFFSKEQIEDFLRNGNTITYTQKNIKKKVKPENYRKFLKHMYNYNLQS